MPLAAFRFAPAALLCGVAFAVGAPRVCAQPSAADLNSLYKQHRWFELRKAAAAGAAPAFYRGAADCAFRNLPQCAATLRGVIRSRPGSDDAVEAHRILVSAYLREGRYAQALAEADALLAVRPDDGDAKGDRPLLQVLARHSDQAVLTRGPSALRLEEHGLRVLVNGRRATYWFDTGANLSVISESEAKRLGLSVLAAETKAGVMTGAEIRFRIAVAEDFRLGSLRLRNVAFLVFPDEQQPFDTLPQESRGLIGIPVLLALERFSVDRQRRFEIAPGGRRLSSGEPNLCFDGKNPVVRVRYGRQPLAFTLDTGASRTDLYPPFAARFRELLLQGRKRSQTMQGVGSTQSFDSVELPGVRLGLDEALVSLRPATVLLKENGELSRFFDGNIGIDLLLQPRRTTLDFGSMNLLAR